MEQFIQKKEKRKMGILHPLSVKLCEERPVPTSWECQAQSREQPRAAAKSRAVLLRGEKCLFLSCFCNEESR